MTLEYWERVVERIFDIDKRVRAVVITDMKYHTILSRMRRATESLTPVDAESIISIVPRIIIEGAQKLEPFLGPMEIVSTKYKKALVVFYKAGEYLVLLSFDQSVETPFHTKLANELARILY